jgi:DNA-directed RNA polymerase specialized sigma24 family protein
MTNYNQQGVNRLMDAVMHPTAAIPTIPQDPISLDELEEYDDITPDGKASLEDAYIEQEKAGVVKRAISRLSPKMQVVVQGTMQGKPQIQIAKEAGVLPTAISNLYRRALSEMRADPELRSFYLDGED